MYYISQVTVTAVVVREDVADIDPGKTGARRIFEFAADRVDGTELELEWADQSPR